MKEGMKEGRKAMVRGKEGHGQEGRSWTEGRGKEGHERT
jgi:hypothetical protein